jgi:hypothetical protein
MRPISVSHFRSSTLKKNQCQISFTTLQGELQDKFVEGWPLIQLKTDKRGSEHVIIVSSPLIRTPFCQGADSWRNI